MSAPGPDAGVTLALDASTYVGTAAVLRGGAVLAQREVAMRGEREERLMPAVADALRAAGASVGDATRVFCGAGPGSFTSLRIAASLAKGIASARDIPLYARSSLFLVVAGAEEPLPDGSYLAVLDALRGEVYASPVIVVGAEIAEAPAVRVRETDLRRLAESHDARIVGPERELDVRPHARGAALAAGWMANTAPVDLAGWEPDYGRTAEAQVRWEAAHGRPLRVG